MLPIISPSVRPAVLALKTRLNGNELRYARFKRKIFGLGTRRISRDKSFALRPTERRRNFISTAENVRTRDVIARLCTELSRTKFLFPGDGPAIATAQTVRSSMGSHARNPCKAARTNVVLRYVHRTPIECDKHPFR